MVRIIAAMKIFNEAWHLEKTLKSVLGSVDHVIVVDGAWDHYPGGLPWSNDGTLDILKKVMSSVTPTFVLHGGILWDSQPQARTEYFRHGQPGDWFLQVDGDYDYVSEVNLREWVEENEDSDFNTGMVKFIDDEDEHVCYFPLLLKWVEDMQYKGNHYSLYEDGVKRVVRGLNVPDTIIYHRHKDKPQEKKKGMEEYSLWRRERAWKED